MLQADEKSQRALLLSEAVIGHNAANYTAWQFRRACIRQLAPDDDDAPASTDDSLWRRELAFCTAATLNNPKNYQVWFHRRACLEALGAVLQVSDCFEPRSRVQVARNTMRDLWRD